MCIRDRDFDIQYKEWIITYSDESFEKLADSLENLIETNKETYDINHAKYLYRRAMELELDFFNAYSDFWFELKFIYSTFNIELINYVF